MNTFILIGSEEKIRVYLERFKKENNIPSYYSIVYEDFKILDARFLQKTISQKLGQNEKRIFVISNPTPEAQNAILKTIEELPEYAFVFFISNNRESFLSTILSRSRIIDLGLNVFEDKVMEKELKNLFLNNDSKKLHLIIEALETELEIEKFILSLRNIIRDFIKSGKESFTLFILLKKINSNYSLIKSNNINRKLSLEEAVLTLDSMA